MKTTNLNQFKGMLLSAIILLCIPFFCNAHNFVKGHIYDSNNQPIQYATAVLLNPATNFIEAGDMCNENGEFVIENIEPGLYILSIQNMGFEKIESGIIVISSEYDLSSGINFQLKEAVIELKEIEVVSKRMTYEVPVTEITSL